MTLPDGQRVAIHVVGDGSIDRTVVVCHSAPGSGAFDPDPEVTWKLGVPLVDNDGLWITGFLSAAAGRHAAWPKRREKQ